jgi:uroporphyrin-III C-methyltransferase/precorrin-2 dehydrogenase/sirohydrochlorin ferrochelatase/uroporphyrin-III C-methyltransferase
MAFGSLQDTQDGLNLGVNWKSLADPDTTLVIYMGLTHIKRIANELISAGLPHDHPTAAINMGKLAEQRVIKAYLSSISNRIDEAKLSGATLIIIRRIFNLSEKLSWFKP